MNRKSLWLVVAAVLAGATLTTIFANTEQGETGARWEYRGVVIRSPFAAVDGCGEIEAELQGMGKLEVSSRVVGDRVIAGLKELDQIAYIRYAIVYLQLDDLASIRAEIDWLLEPTR